MKTNSRKMQLTKLCSTMVAAGIITVPGYATAQSELPSREKMWEIIQEQQKQIEALKQEQTETRQQVESTEQKVEATGDMVESVAQQTQGTGDEWFNRTSIGGYGEVHFLSDDSLEGGEGGEAGDGDGKATAKRLVFEFAHQFNDRLRFQSELEFENALVIGGSESGEVEVEQAYVGYDLNNRHTVRGGMQLVPVGLLNETHEPPTFFGVQRNLVERRIIPTTWRELAVAATGQFGNGFSYDAMLSTGLDVSREGAEGGEGAEFGNPFGNAFQIATGPQSGANAKAETGALTLALDWSGMPGLTIGASGQYQADVTQDEQDVDATLFEAHVDFQRGGFGLRALYARWDVDSGGVLEGAEGAEGAEGGEGLTIGDSGREEQYGWYVEPSYTFQTGKGDLGVFARYSQVDDQADADVDSRIDSIVTGVNFWPAPNVVLKANYQQQDIEGEEGERDSFNLGVGWQF